LLQRLTELEVDLKSLKSAFEEMAQRARLAALPDDQETGLKLMYLELSRGGHSSLARSCVAENRSSEDSTRGPWRINFHLPDVLFHEDSSAVIRERAICAEIYRCLCRSGVPFAVHAQKSYAPDFYPTEGEIHLTWHTRGLRENTFHVKDAELPGLFYIDPYGYSGWAEMSCPETHSAIMKGATIAEIRRSHRALYARYVEQQESKYKQQKRNFRGRRPYVFFALQTVDDEVMDLANIDMLDFLKWVGAVAKRNSLNLVVKRHPMCDSGRVSDLLKEMESEAHVCVTDASIHEIIPGAEAVLTVNSGVGLEALLHLKHVFVAGDASYQSCCHRIDSLAGVEHFPDVLAQPVNDRDIMQFLHLLSTVHLYDVEHSERTIRRIRSLAFPKQDRWCSKPPQHTPPRGVDPQVHACGDL